jgi:hypothetical protein
VFLFWWILKYEFTIINVYHLSFLKSTNVPFRYLAKHLTKLQYQLFIDILLTFGNSQEELARMQMMKEYFPDLISISQTDKLSIIKVQFIISNFIHLLLNVHSLNAYQLQRIPLSLTFCSADALASRLHKHQEKNE